MSNRLISHSPERVYQDVAIFLATLEPPQSFRRATQGLKQRLQKWDDRVSARHSRVSPSLSKIIKQLYPPHDGEVVGEPDAANRASRTFVHTTLLGESVAISVMEGDMPDECLVSYEARNTKAASSLLWLTVIIGLLPLLLMVLNSGRMVFLLFLFTRYIASTQPELFRDMGLEAIIPLCAVIGLALVWITTRAISRAREARFWAHIGFDKEADRIIDGTLLAEGNKQVGPETASVFLLTICAGLLYLLRVPGCAIVILVLASLWGQCAAGFSRSAGYHRRALMARRFGFRMMNRSVEFILVHAMLLWATLAFAKIADTQLLVSCSPKTMFATEQVVSLYHWPRIWGFRVNPSDLTPITSGDLSFYGLSNPPGIDTFGRYCIDLARSTPSFFQGMFPLREASQAIAVVMALMILLIPCLFFNHAVRASISWRKMYNGGLLRGEYLEVIEPSRWDRATEGAFHIWTLVGCVLQCIIFAIAVLLAAEIAVRAVTGHHIAGLECIWLPYSFLSAVLDEAAWPQWVFGALLGAHVVGLLFIPIILAAGTVVRALRRLGTWRLLSRRMPATRFLPGPLHAVVSDSICVQPGDPLKGCRAAWNMGLPIVHIPASMLETGVSAGDEAEGRRIVSAVVLHEAHHLARMPGRRFLSGMALCCGGDIWPIEVMTDYVAEEIAADRSAAAVLGASAYIDVLENNDAKPRRPFRAKISPVKAVLQNLWNPVWKVLSFLFYPALAAYAHPRLDTRIRVLRETSQPDQPPAAIRMPPKAYAIFVGWLGFVIGLALLCAMLTLTYNAIAAPHLEEKHGMISATEGGSWQHVSVISGKEVTAAIEHEGRVYVSTDEGLYRMTAEAHGVEQLIMPPSRNRKSNRVHNLLIVQGQLVVCAENTILLLTSQGIRTVRAFPESFVYPLDDMVHFTSVCEGKRCWLLQAARSLAIFDGQRIRVWLYQDGSNDVPVWRDSNSRLHAVTETGHRVLDDNERGFLTTLPAAQPRFLGLQKPPPLATLEPLNDGDILVDTCGNGWRVEASTKQTRLVRYGTAGPAIKEGSANYHPVRMIGPDRQNRILIVGREQQENGQTKPTLELSTGQSVEQLPTAGLPEDEIRDGTFLFVDRQVVFLSRNGQAMRLEANSWRSIWRSVFEVKGEKWKGG